MTKAASIVVDGYNLIRQVGALAEQEKHSLEQGRAALVKLLGRYRRLKPHKITVVFDGQNEVSEFPSAYQQTGVTICFSPSHLTADEVMRGYCQQLGSRAIVVSSDRGVTDFAKKCGSTTIGAVEFYHKLRQSELMSTSDVSDDPNTESRPAHKRWTTYKKGPRKKLPKKERRGQQRLKKL